MTTKKSSEESIPETASVLCVCVCACPFPHKCPLFEQSVWVPAPVANYTVQRSESSYLATDGSTTCGEGCFFSSLSFLLQIQASKKRSTNPNVWVRISSEGVGVFHVNGWGPKSSVCPSKLRESQLLGGICQDFCRDIPGWPEKFKKKKVCVQFLANNVSTFISVVSVSRSRDFCDLRLLPRTSESRFQTQDNVMLNCDLRLQWKLASEMRITAALFKPKTFLSEGGPAICLLRCQVASDCKCAIVVR